MSAVVTSFDVALTRSPGSGAGSPVRIIQLFFAPGTTGTVKNVALFFYDPPPASEGAENSTGTFLSVFLPLSDFEDFYLLLRTEKTVTADWGVDPSKNVSFFTLTSGTDTVALGSLLKTHSATARK
jgi:hypothetical protein